MLALGLVADAQRRQTPTPGDPYEPTNRKIYNFNDSLDRNIMQPVARGYVKVTPKPARTGIGNFMSNVEYLNVSSTIYYKARGGNS